MAFPFIYLPLVVDRWWVTDLTPLLPGLGEQRDAGRVAVKKIRAAHRTDLALREKAGDGDIARPLARDGHVVVGAPEEPAAPATAAEQQRTQRRFLIFRLVSGQHQVKILARGLGIAHVELDRLPFADHVADGYTPGRTVGSDEVANQEVA